MPAAELARRDALKLLAGSCFFGVAETFALATTPSEVLSARLRGFVDSNKVAGVVALVSRAGRDSYLEAIGSQDLEQHVPMRTDTIFDMRSMTKEITATALMCLVEDGKVHLDDLVSNYIPEFASIQVAHTGEPLRKPSRPITLLDLLTETSGMAEDRPKSIENITRTLDRTLEEVARIVATQPLETDPGVRWKYASMGYAVIGRVVELRSGRRYEDFVAERIFRPLKMRDSFFFPPHHKWPRIAAMYNMENGILKRDVIDIYRKGAKYPAPEFGMFSTARDMERFFRMTMNGGTLDGHRVLSADSMYTMLKPRVPTSIDGVSQGLAWFICTDPSKQAALRLSKGSFGAAGASGTFGWIDPDQKLIRLLLMQRFGGSNDERNAFMSLAATI